MLWDEEISQEETDEVIDWLAQQFYKYGLETAGILFLESLKPISRYGSSMGQLFLTPIMPFFGDNIMTKSDRVMRILEDKENVEKLIQRLENVAVHGVKQVKNTKEDSEKHNITEQSNKEKKSWRRILPF
jgi:hypothetical protein